jgi:hypothetical protein
MATIYWKGDADAVPQVTTIQITADDAATTYRVTIGGVDVEVVGSGTGVNDTATALQAALADTATLPPAGGDHPYFEAITWTVATDTVTGTAATAGVPFVVTTSVTGGTGTIGAPSTTTASSGPNDWSTADNWSGGSVPGAADEVIFEDNGVNVCWGLDQSAAGTLTSLTVDKSYTGKIGLNYRAFATSSDGDTTDTTKLEYRDVYLNFRCSNVSLGPVTGTGSPAGSQRIMLDLGSVASTVEVFGTASKSAEVGRNAVRLLASSASTTLDVRDAPGGVGVAAEVPGETSTISSATCVDPSTGTKVEIGEGTTITTFTQTGGTNLLRAAATVTTVTVEAGTLTIEADQTVTTLEARGGTVFANNVPSAGNAITTLNMDGGTVDATRSAVARTWATVNLNEAGSSLTFDPDVLTITTLNEPTSGGKRTLAVS